MVILYKFNEGNKISNTIGKMRGNTYTYDSFISDSYDNIKNTIGLGDFCLKYVQYDNDNVNIKEGEKLEIENEEDVDNLISRIRHNRDNIDKIIIENVDGILYISVKPGETYWIHYQG
jgi:predicted DNA-binding antitoxin AbrB/MazE fold protein